MEDSAYTERTIELYIALKKSHARAGIALQAYLYRTADDIDRLLPLCPTIRLVKGAYDEPATIAFAKKSGTDRNYHDLACRMLDAARENKCLPVFGTHDTALIEEIARHAIGEGVDRTKYEVHMLYGIREGEQIRLVAEGYTVKTLISYGSAWFKWYMRRLAERPANVLFAARALIG